MAYNYACLCYMEKIPLASGGYTVEERSCPCKGKNIQMSDKDDYVCMQTGEPLKLVGETMSGHVGPKMTQEQIRVDRKARSTEHFKREIFPTLGKDEQRHHVKKDPTLLPSIDLKFKERNKKKIFKIPKEK